MGTSPFTAITGIFGAVQERRAMTEARRIINQAREEATARAGDYQRMFAPFLEKGTQYMEKSAEAIAAAQNMLQEQGNQIEVGQGLTAADEIAYKDAAKLLNEQMVGTGNLRSGAAAFGQTELLRRVVADANQRNFNRRIAKLQVMFGGMDQAAGQYGQLGSVSSQVGLQGQQLGAQLLQSALGFAPMQAQNAIRIGQAESNKITSYGVAADEFKDTIREGYGDMLQGAAVGASVMGSAGKMMGGM